MSSAVGAKSEGGNLEASPLLCSQSANVHRPKCMKMETSWSAKLSCCGVGVAAVALSAPLLAAADAVTAATSGSSIAPGVRRAASGHGSGES